MILLKTYSLIFIIYSFTYTTSDGMKIRQKIRQYTSAEVYIVESVDTKRAEIFCLFCIEKHMNVRSVTSPCASLSAPEKESKG